MKLPDDPIVLELLPEFVDTWIDDMKSQFKKYCDERNGDDLYRLAHTLKGSCFQFGLNEIAEMGIEVMGFAKNDQFEDAAKYEKIILDKFLFVKEYIKEI